MSQEFPTASLDITRRLFPWILPCLEFDVLSTSLGHVGTSLEWNSNAMIILIQALP